MPAADDAADAAGPPAAAADDGDHAQPETGAGAAQ
jgi:hypothetical protein